MERRDVLVAEAAGSRVDVQRPGQVGRTPEQLLVEVVAEAPDRLAEARGPGRQQSRNVPTGQPRARA